VIYHAYLLGISPERGVTGMLRVPTTTKAAFGNQPLSITPDNAQSERAAKAIFDYLFVVPTLILLAPLLLIIALLIKLESPGPVLNKQRVIGKHGRFFAAYNFRTTYIDGNNRLIRNRDEWVAMLNSQGTTASDPRVTRVGYYLRRFGLDDLPRLLNIINRQMSLVGPSILNHQDVAKLGTRRVDNITAIKPGLTGLGQIRSRYSSVVERYNIELDYINNWSVKTDFQILLDTFHAVREDNIL
jgi:lipopolysaccharide/colanic/teichoic acid biosynthesis glycosyltransferase